MMSLLSTLLAYIQLLEMTKSYLKFNLTIPTTTGALMLIRSRVSDYKKKTFLATSGLCCFYPPAAYFPPNDRASRQCCKKAHPERVSVIAWGLKSGQYELMSPPAPPGGLFCEQAHSALALSSQTTALLYRSNL